MRSLPFGQTPAYRGSNSAGYSLGGVAVLLRKQTRWWGLSVQNTVACWGLPARLKDQEWVVLQERSISAGSRCVSVSGRQSGDRGNVLPLDPHRCPSYRIISKHGSPGDKGLDHSRTLDCRRTLPKERGGQLESLQAERADAKNIPPSRLNV